ncbi:hypothetical protein [Cutibacterium modestum]|uniref:Uncharacterized protein n=2 Tax=Cutibacterium modestum TaxID=2559073 RepID=A0AAD1NVS3_9ACTN|nr:hypothetical protein [Cutibacterium modestum]EGG26879.1 hypothetical protein PA08_1116 [Cutibacterium modestum P08]BCY25448.1 hypothetical protein KB1_14380 [Cutibacterium modestum]
MGSRVVTSQPIPIPSAPDVAFVLMGELPSQASSTQANIWVAQWAIDARLDPAVEVLDMGASKATETGTSLS